MKKKLNPFTGALDFVGSPESENDDCVVLLNAVTIEATGDLEINDEACLEVKNSSSNFAQRIKQTVTITSLGEMLIGANSEVEVIS